MTIVFVWNNNMFSTGNYNIGHAAMLIDDNWRGSNDLNYVSFWPDDGANKNTAAGASSLASHLGSDCISEKYIPDHCIEVPGLKTDKMIAEWGNAKRYGKYEMRRENCSAAVARVLKSGTTSGSVWQRHSVVWTPLKVKRLALSMGGHTLTWGNVLDRMVRGQRLTEGQAKPLRGLPRRDAKHGSSSPNYRFKDGKDVGGKQPMSWPGQVRMASGSMLNGHTDLSAMLDAIQRQIDEA